jgi:RNA polymerase sigma-70 factor (ECF subfamily)
MAVQVEEWMEQPPAASRRGVDPWVIDGCRQGDREAFRLLFEAYRDRVYSIALHCLRGDEASAEDVTQEVFLRLFTRIGQFRGEADLATWLYRLVANACVDEQRKPTRLVPYGNLDEVGEMAARTNPAADYEKVELADSVQAALADLSPTLRMAILLKYFEELSYEEMARALGCSPGTVASRLHRGLKLLGRRLAHLRGALACGEPE